MTDRRVEYMTLEEVQRAPRNPKDHDQEGIQASISHFGLADLPVLDDRTGRLVSGHGRLDDIAARHAAGQDPPDGVKVRKGGVWLVPVVRGWSSRSDEDAEAYVITANSTTIRGGWDDPQLGQILSDLAEADTALFALTRFTEGDIERLLAEKSEPEPPGEFPSYDENIPTEHICPACGYQFSGGKGSSPVGDD